MTNMRYEEAPRLLVLTKKDPSLPEGLSFDTLSQDSTTCLVFKQDIFEARQKHWALSCTMRTFALHDAVSQLSAALSHQILRYPDEA